MKPIARIASRYFSFRETIAVIVALALSVGTGLGVFILLKREIKITDNGNTIQVKSMKKTAGEVLLQNGISVETYDYINHPLDYKLGKKDEIIIKRAVPVWVKVDGQEKQFWTYQDTVRDTLAVNGVELNELDKLNFALNDNIYGDMKIDITRVKEEILKEQEVLPFEVVSRENSRMDEGMSRVVREGEEGIREKEYKVVYENSVETGRTLLANNILSEPVDKIIEYGTIMNFSTSRGETVRYKKVISMSSTAYDLSYESVGKYPGDPLYGITASGMRVRPGVVAVDPRVIPLGTRLYVEGASRWTPDYGFAIAADTGSAIKGNKIDLYYEDSRAARAYGVQAVNVYILTD